MLSELFMLCFQWLKKKKVYIVLTETAATQKAGPSLLFLTPGSFQPSSYGLMEPLSRRQLFFILNQNKRLLNFGKTDEQNVRSKI